MVDLTGDISKLVFRQVLKSDGGDVSIDGQLLGIFLELDGQKNLGAVAQKAGLNLGEMRTAVTRLLDLELIEPAVRQEAAVDQEFLDYLNRQLAEAVGPIASVLIEDHIADAGYRLSDFPVSQIADLIEALSREIQREEKKNLFQVNMINKIKEKGY